ncbi:hypothetical protein [Aurantimonas sp. HBX-1]|uniref:hypothetical protein n=1 Tax=Aurantimonas sp. HBX-1 TaxID=2906072 RepID=UPI001F30EFD7|nr:hypothetical protein [Aurantimonas sp. HBX-1]UIJ73358.1 hypothetical protein LXB15_06890 [Aurantimonas sp. HBX-1]
MTAKEDVPLVEVGTTIPTFDDLIAVDAAACPHTSQRLPRLAMMQAMKERRSFDR